jgi:WD40 repeat protein
MTALVPALAAASTEDPKPRLQIDLGVHSAPARRLSVAPERDLVVTASDDKTARVWELSTGQLRHVLRPGVGAGEIGRLYGSAIHPSEDWVAIAGSTGATNLPHRILIFSPATGRFIKAFDAKGGNIKHLVWSADGTVIFAVYAGDHAVRAFDQAGSTLFERRFAAPAYGLSASPDGRVAATALDGTVLVLEAKSGRVNELRTFVPGTARRWASPFPPTVRDCWSAHSNSRPRPSCSICSEASRWDF